MHDTPTSSRRQFLLAGSAVAAAVMLAGDLVAEPTGLQLLADSPGLRIPVAYVQGSSGATSLQMALSAGATRAVPAVDLGGGGALAGAPARLSLSGFAAPVGDATASYRHVLLDTVVPSPARRGDTIAFYSFTFRGKGASQSAPTRLRIGSGDGLRAGFRLETAGESAGSSVATAVFSSRTGRGLPTLQAGVYLLGLQPGMWSAPVALPAAGSSEWSALQSVVLVVEAEAAE